MTRIKVKIKNSLREMLPAKVYTTVYKAYQKFFGNKNRSHLSGAFSNFIYPGFYDFVLDTISFKIFLDPRNGGVDYEIFAHKNFEAGILKLFKAELKNDDIFLDVGANIGQHSLYASRICKKVYAFEPIQRLYSQFNKSIFENNFFNIYTFNYGLGDKNESLPIYSTDANMGASSILVQEDRHLEQNIKLLKLDDVYEDMGIESINFIKIDVEGYELNVLLGLRNIVQKYKPKILIEFSPCFYRKSDNDIGEKIYLFLIENKYEIYNVDNDGTKK